MDSLVTIAIASFNNASVIERCIRSVINQSYTNLEVLIIDDGSSDNSVEVCSHYLKDERIRIIEKKNGGLSSSRQMAIDEAKGQFLCLIDADDYLLPDHVQNMLSRMNADSSQVCVCSTRVEYSDGTIVQRDTDSLSCTNGELQTDIDSLAGLQYMGLYRYLFLSDSWNKMYNLEFVRSTGVQFNMPKGYNGSDTSFNRRLVLHTPKYSFVSEQGYVHVIYNFSAVHRKGKKLMDSYSFILEQFYYECEKLGITNRMSNWMSCFLASSSRSALSDLFYERESFKSFNNSVKRIKIQTGELLEKFSLPQLNIKQFPSPSLRSYVFIWRYCEQLMPLYIYLRKNH